MHDMGTLGVMQPKGLPDFQVYIGTLCLVFRLCELYGGLLIVKVSTFQDPWFGMVPLY